MNVDLMVDSREGLSGECARRFERAAASAVSARGRFVCAIPGGSVAEACFPALVTASVDWSRTHLFWGDERAVPPDDPQSNYGLARQLWLQYVTVAADHVHRMPADAADLDRAARQYADDLRATAGDPPRLDLVLLGVGADGHVCSLFPGHAALAERARPVIAVVDAPKPPARRLTLTLPVIVGARSVVVCAFGSEKALAVRDALQGGDSPLARATRNHPNVAWLLDPEAASSV
jgi:6-phosphogluconolactonase